MALNPKKKKPLRLGDEQADAAQLLERAEMRVQEKKASAELLKRKKRTPHHKTTHAVRNEDVHDVNTTARQADSRSEIDRDSERPRGWTRPSQLTAPAPRPGYRQKWVRYRSGKEEDTDNLDAHLEQGWRPRKSGSVRRGHELTADLTSKYSQYIVKRGLILMEIPEEMGEQRNRYYRRQADRMTDGIDNDMFKLNHHAMPLLAPERRTRVQRRLKRGSLEEQIEQAGGAE